MMILRSALSLSDTLIHGPLLTGLADLIPPRAAHVAGRVLGLSTVIEIFCECCPSCGIWDDAEDECSSTS